MSENYYILAVDDHPVVLEGLRMIVSRIKGVQCTGLTCVEDLKRTLPIRSYDMYILDLEFPDTDGFCIINEIRERKPDAHIVIYTMHEEPWVLAKLVNLDIDGVISKNVDAAELHNAVETIMAGNTYFNEAFLKLVQRHADPIPSNGNIFKLSAREQEVLSLLAEGLSTTEIAEKMFLSKNTIQTYRKRLMLKLNAKNVAELVVKGSCML